MYISILLHLADPIAHVIFIACLLWATACWAQTAPYTCPAGQMMTSQLANTGASCSQLSYSSLVGLPTIPASQLQSDWNEANTSLLDYIKNKPTIPVVQAYENTTQRLNPILINKTVAVAGGGGNATFNLTSDGTSSGTALCPNGVMLNSPNLSVNDATAPYQYSWVWSNFNKTVTVLTEKASGLAVLTFTLLGIPAPVANGTSVNGTFICY